MFLTLGALVGFVQSRSASGRVEPGVILVLGDSLSAGYGIDPEQAFPGLIQQRLVEEGRAYRVLNASVSGETSAGGLRRIEWLLRQSIDVFVLELGANDGLRGVQVAETRRNLTAILQRIRQANPDVKLIIAGMRVPPNLGRDYSNAFEAVFVELARQYDAALIPFLLEGVAGRPHLNLPDGIHPTPEGHKIVAKLVWGYLVPLLD